MLPGALFEGVLLVRERPCGGFRCRSPIAVSSSERSNVMLQISQSLPRTLALLVCTALFAGLWSNDRPARAMAMKTAPLPRGIVEAEPEWVPISAAVAARASQPETPLISSPVSASSSARMEVTLGEHSKHFRLETSDLLIADELLQAHLNQLPLGISPGDYRIVDPLGGVGWLHVRVEGNRFSSRSPAPLLLTTTVDAENVRFISVTGTTAGGNSSGVSR